MSLPVPPQDKHLLQITPGPSLSAEISMEETGSVHDSHPSHIRKPACNQIMYTHESRSPISLKSNYTHTNSGPVN